MKLKASYTVEASVVISICFIMFGTAALLAFELFKETLDYVSGQPDAIDAVALFRLKEGVAGVIHALQD